MSVILMYHSTSTEISNELMEVHPSSLVKHLNWLQDLGYEVVSLKELLTENNPKHAAITFDDGYLDFVNIFPFLEDNEKLHVTLFICCGDLGASNYWASQGRNTKELMDKAMVLDIVQYYKSIHILPHGWFHTRVTELSNKRLSDDLTRSLEWFGTELGLSPDTIAYPFGSINARTAIIMEKHFKYGLTVDVKGVEGVNKRLCIPRIPAVNHMSFEWLRKQCKIYDSSSYA